MEREQRKRGATTILELLRERMDGVDRLRRRKSLQERLGLQGMVCCGPTWAFGPSTMSVRDEDEENDPTHPESEEIQIIDVGQTLLGTTNDQDCLSHSPPSTAVSGMNLAAALAAERNFRAAEQDPEPVHGTNPNTVATAVPEANGNVTSGGMTSAPGTPLRVSLMRLLTESDGLNESTEEKGGGGNDQMCCVCMGRKKGAAFIPCGHTFCRVCSRELWLNRGSCPLCNRSILEILDIY